MQWQKRLHLFWLENKTKILITSAVLGLVVLSVWAMMSLESFYRNITLAQLPVSILMGMIHAVVFVYMYTSVFSNRWGGGDKKKQIKAKEVNVRFDDVIGIDEAKEEAWEVVQLIKDHTKLRKIGGKILKGILMIGPPGCGKTYLAKAIATESGLPFISMAASEFNEMFVGVGASRVRKLFKRARLLAYGYGGCIIFIDELDAMGSKRTFSQFGSGEGNTTQNQLLVEMDGVGSGKENVIIIGATNAREEILDEALLRPGRFDRKLYITKPGLEGREKLFRFYLDKVRHETSIDVGHLARKSVGKSPAEIENIIKEAALIATRNEKDFVSYKEITEAIERIELGVKSRRRMTLREKEMTAYHEAGHLMVTYLLHPTDDVFKASIVPRKSSLGVVHHQPREEHFSHDKDKLLADIKSALAGYAAEKMKFKVTTTGVSMDFRHAMQIAHTMVWSLGMGDTGMVGDYTAIPKDEISSETKTKLNQDTNALVKRSIEEVEGLLAKHNDIFERFAQELLRREELEYDDIEAIFAEYGIQNPRKDEDWSLHEKYQQQAARTKSEDQATKHTDGGPVDGPSD
ncbi:MAG: AAA family ATPase [Candidatus Omnitrophica bacterium]|nr:AAA family ATPase [Candidatus Omnitrophota bacterium]